MPHDFILKLKEDLMKEIREEFGEKILGKISDDSSPSQGAEGFMNDLKQTKSKGVFHLLIFISICMIQLFQSPEKFYFHFCFYISKIHS